MTTRLTDEQIAELERLEREATPGPWKNAYRSVRADPPDRHNRSPWIADIPQGGARWREDQNCALIVAARNALPSLLAEVRASRSSSGSGEREAVHGEDVAHACAHAHGMGQEDGFRAGVEAAAQIVAGWHIKRGGYLVLAEAVRALSSAPPSPDSGERDAELDRLLSAHVHAGVRCGVARMSIEPEQAKIDEADREWRESRERIHAFVARASGERVRALEEALRKVMKAKSGTEAYETARRALSPQGDGGTP